MYPMQTQSYVKLMLHAAKRPENSACGLLLGQKQGHGVTVSDAMPLFHHEAPLAPLLEVACAMVEAFCQTDPNLTIVGFYYAENGHSSSDSGTGLSHFAEKVADKVAQQCAQACVLLVRRVSDPFFGQLCCATFCQAFSADSLLNNHPYVHLCMCLSLVCSSCRWTVSSLATRRKLGCRCCERTQSAAGVGPRLVCRLQKGLHKC